MNRAGFLKTLGLGGIAAATVPALDQAATATAFKEPIAKSPKPWTSELTGRTFGWNPRQSKWVRVQSKEKPTPLTPEELHAEWAADVEKKRAYWIEHCGPVESFHPDPHP